MDPRRSSAPMTLRPQQHQQRTRYSHVDLRRVGPRGSLGISDPRPPTDAADKPELRASDSVLRLDRTPGAPAAPAALPLVQASSALRQLLKSPTAPPETFTVLHKAERHPCRASCWPLSAGACLRGCPYLPTRHARARPSACLGAPREASLTSSPREGLEGTWALSCAAHTATRWRLPGRQPAGDFKHPADLVSTTPTTTFLQAPPPPPAASPVPSSLVARCPPPCPPVGLSPCRWAQAGRCRTGALGEAEGVR